MAVNIQTLENDRAKFAFEEIQKLLNRIEDIQDEAKKKKKKNEFKSWAKKIAVMIKMNGLGQTMAFLVSKSKGDENEGGLNHYEFYYQLTEKWLKEKGLLSNEKTLIKDIVETKSSVYRGYTREALALFNWVRRFVDGYL